MEPEKSEEGQRGETKHPDETNPIRAPFVPLAVARRLITTLGWCVIGLTIVTIILGIAFSTSINRKPWILVATENGYQEMGVGRQKTTRGEIEQFVNFVIPNIYGSINGAGPGLKRIQGLVNENIITEQEKELGRRAKYLQDNGISQFAVVTGVNPETMVIDRNKKIAYVEALGTIVLSKEDRSQKTDVQWRCLLYIVEPTNQLAGGTPGGRMQGNRMGLFLQQIAEQPPGTVNTDSPKPTAGDIQEKAQEEEKKGKGKP